MSQPLSGIYVPHIVPYDPSGRINEDELRRIINWLGEKGVTGFYPNGSMGEFIRLGYEERKQVARKRVLMGDIRSRIACVLAECGFSEAAQACGEESSQPGENKDLQNQVDDIVRKVL